MQLDIEARDDLLIIAVAENRIDAAGAIQFKERMREATQHPATRVVLDLSRVAFLDSSGLGAVVAVMKLLGPDRRLELSGLTPTVEKVQQQADQAVFERRALAVEKERAIAENELHNKIELARREEELITRESANSRQKAEAEAEASRIAADAQAANIRVIDQARADMESAHVQAYAGQPAAVVFGLAVQELAGKINSIEHLNITPDMFSTLLADAVEKSTKKGG